MSAAGKRKTNLFLVLLLVLTLCFIWGNSLLSKTDSAQVSGTVMDRFAAFFRLLGLDTEDDYWLRMTAHVVEFAALGLELAALFFLNRGRSLQSGANAAFAALLAAFTDEGLQYLSARAPEVKDMALDFFGALLGILLIALLWREKTGQPEQ